MAKKKPRIKEFVLDAAVALAWCFPDEKAPYPQAVLDSFTKRRAVAPILWPFEVANTLLVGERRKRCTQADTATWLAFLSSLPITLDDETRERAWSDGLNLARAHNLSAYDAAYLELALRRGLKLATLDRNLRAAAKAVGVAEYEP